MDGFPFFFYGLTGVYVAILLTRKSAAVPFLARVLSLLAALTAVLVGVTALYVFFTQSFEIPGAALVMLPATLLSIAFWTASLIWAGPPTREDRLVFTGAAVLISMMLVSAPVLG